MRGLKYVLFDLDGTLLDSGEGIINSVKYALGRYGIEESDPGTLRSFVGPPLVQRFEECYGFSPEESRKALFYFREYYEEKGIFQNRMYEGVPQLLKALKDADKKIMVATSKPEKLAHKILAQHDLSVRFDFIGGSLMDETRSTKAEVLKYVLEENGIKKDCAGLDALMVGDTKYDVIGAKKFGIAAVGVTYGYGSREELVQAGARHIADSPKAVQDILLHY